MRRRTRSCTCLPPPLQITNANAIRDSETVGRENEALIHAIEEKSAYVIVLRRLCCWCCRGRFSHPQRPHPAPGFRHDLTSPTRHARFDSRRGGATRAASFERKIFVRGETAAPRTRSARSRYTHRKTQRPAPALLPGAACGSLRSRPPSRVARRSRAPRPPPAARRPPRPQRA
jgi:hypothetical protein